MESDVFVLSGVATFSSIKHAPCRTCNNIAPPKITTLEQPTVSCESKVLYGFMPDESASSVIANCNNSAIRSGTRELGIPSVTDKWSSVSKSSVFGNSQPRTPVPLSRQLNAITNGKCLKTCCYLFLLVFFH